MASTAAQWLQTRTPEEYREPIINGLTVAAPPLALVARHLLKPSTAEGEASSELGRHLALSVALCCSFVGYIPAMIHAFWLLNVRDAGGFVAYAESTQLYQQYGGPAKEWTVQTHSKFSAYWQTVRAWIEKAQSAFVSTKKWVLDVYEDGHEAWEAGEMRQWAEDKTSRGWQAAKSAAVPYPRFHAILVYVDQRKATVIDATVVAWEWTKNTAVWVYEKLTSTASVAAAKLSATDAGEDSGVETGRDDGAHSPSSTSSVENTPTLTSGSRQSPVASPTSADYDTAPAYEEDEEGEEFSKEL